MQHQNLLAKALRDLEQTRKRTATEKANEAWTIQNDDRKAETKQLTLNEDSAGTAEDPVPEKPRRSPSIFEDVALFCSQIEAAPQLIDGVLEEDSVVALVGPPNCGKSFVALDWACSVATGLSWQGHATVEGPVVYLAGEGRSGLQRRINAWQEQFGVIQPSRMQISTRGADLTSLDHVKAVAHALEGISKRSGESPKLIVIDTVARHFGESDENSTRDMNKFISLLDDLRRVWNCTILLVHHTGKDAMKGARGSTALRGAVDTEYALNSSDGILSLVCTKSKDSAIPDAVTMQLEEVKLESVVKPDGTSVTTCVLRGSGDTGKRSHLGLSGNAHVYWDSFLEVERYARLQSDNPTDIPTWYLVKAVNAVCTKRGVNRSTLSNIKVNYANKYDELHKLLVFNNDHVARRSALDVQQDVQLFN